MYVCQQQRTGTADQRERQQAAVVRAKPQAHDVRDDQPDEADDPRKRHGCCRRQGSRQQDQGPRPRDRQSHLLSLVVAKLQQVQGVPAQDQDAQPDGQEGQDCQHRFPAGLRSAADQPGDRPVQFARRAQHQVGGHGGGEGTEGHPCQDQVRGGDGLAHPRQGIDQEHGQQRAE